MRILKLFLTYTVCFIFFFSCVSTSQKDTLFVNLTDNSKFILLPAEGIESAMDMAQFLSTKFRQQDYFFNAWVKADENSIEMTLFNEMGASIGELSYRNGAVQFSSAVIPKAAMKYIKPEYIIADFQLCFYDPSLLNKSLNDSGLTLEVNNGNRRVLNKNEVIIEINKTANAVELRNHLRKYVYTMEGDFNAVQ